MRTPTIAIYDMGQSAFRYIAQSERAGASILPFKYIDSEKEARDIAGHCDGLLLPGGCDVNPKLYGQPLKSWCKKIDDMRDSVEYALLSAFANAGKPVLGICRGAQVINAFFGGTLYQDIAKDAGRETLEHWHDVGECDEPIHRVVFEPDSLISEIFGTSESIVNTIHHQAADAIPDVLRVTARADDGVVEAVEHRTLRFVLGIQWHPERLAPKDDANFAVFKRFIDECR